MRLGRVEVSAGCLLLLAWLNYWDTQGVVPLALAACLLHELAHYGALRLAGAGVRLGLSVEAAKDLYTGRVNTEVGQPAVGKRPLCRAYIPHSAVF